LVIVKCFDYCLYTNLQSKMAKMFQVLDGTETLNPFDLKLLLFQKYMWKEVVKVLQPFFSISIFFYSDQVHNMLVVMLDLQFKSLQVVEDLVGCGNAIWLISEYDLKAMIPLSMVRFETLNPTIKAYTSTSPNDLPKQGNMFRVGGSFWNIFSSTCHKIIIFIQKVIHTFFLHMQRSSCLVVQTMKVNFQTLWEIAFIETTLPCN